MDYQQTSPGTPKTKSDITQVPTPPSTKRKPTKAPPKTLKIKIAPRGRWSSIPQKSSFQDAGPSILQRRNAQAQASKLLDRGVKQEPENDDDGGLVNIKQESGESPVVPNKKFSKEEFMKFVKANLPSNEYCCIARNPFYRGEALDGPYYEWLRDSYYKGEMPEIIRRCNKFRGFPQLDDEEANPAEWELYAEKYATEEWQKEFEPYQKEIDLYLADPRSEFNVTKRRMERAERRAIRRRLAEYYGEPYDEEDSDEGGEEEEVNDGKFVPPPPDSPYHDPDRKEESLPSASLSTGTMAWTPYHNSEILGSTAGNTPKLPQHIGQAAQKRAKRPYKPRKSKGRRGGKRKRDDSEAEFVDNGDDSDSEDEHVAKTRKTTRVTRSRAKKSRSATEATEVQRQTGPDGGGQGVGHAKQDDDVQSPNMDGALARIGPFNVRTGKPVTRPRRPGEWEGGWTTETPTENPWENYGTTLPKATGTVTRVSGVDAEDVYAHLNGEYYHSRISPSERRSGFLGQSFTSPNSAFFPYDIERRISPLTSPAGPFSPLTHELPLAGPAVDDSLKSSSGEDHTTDNENEFTHLINSGRRDWIQDQEIARMEIEPRMAVMAGAEESIYS